jgi:DNA-binding IclR family transcriptional regulator
MKPLKGSSARPPATIKDIANALGLSHSTVSRALNDFPHLSADTKARVREKAAELEYVVNSGARTLRYANSSLVGLVAPHPTNDLSAAMARVLASQCQRAGYQLVLSMCEDDEVVELRQVKRAPSASSSFPRHVSWRRPPSCCPPPSSSSIRAAIRGFRPRPCRSTAQRGWPRPSPTWRSSATGGSPMSA